MNGFEFIIVLTVVACLAFTALSLARSNRRLRQRWETEREGRVADVAYLTTIIGQYDAERGASEFLSAGFHRQTMDAAMATEERSA